MPWLAWAAATARSATPARAAGVSTRKISCGLPAPRSTPSIVAHTASVSCRPEPALRTMKSGAASAGASDRGAADTGAILADEPA
jgi:hypothetical protein